jgi:site-specific DNA-methyltransferase (adenine-specific)
MRKEHLKISVGSLKVNERNPKLHAEDLIKKSIAKLGFVDDIVIDENNMILAGHGRLKALLALGHTEVDAIRISGWSELEKDQYMLVSNKSVELGGWDMDKLAQFDIPMLEETGFKGDLDRILGIEEDDFDAQKEYDSIIEAVTQPGEIFQLGEHRLMCGDSVKAEAYTALLGDEKARLIFTDPPYNVNYESGAGHSYDKGKFHSKKMFNDNKTDDDCLRFYTSVLEQLFSFSSDDATIYWWFATKNSWINQFAFANAGWHMSQIIMWLKNSMILSYGCDYHRCYEPCMLGWKEKQQHYKNKKLNNLKDVFHLDIDTFSQLLDVWYEKRDNTSEYLHPTQKPVRLAERALRKNSEEGDIILDVFGGSGSTLIGCEQMRRKCRVIELDPKYCDVILKRWERFTHKQAIKL